MPDAAWITQEWFDNLTDQELRNTINEAPDFNGTPDFVVEARSRSDRRPPLLAKMAEWTDGGAGWGWLLDPIDRRVYIYRRDQPVAKLENPATLDGADVRPGFVFEVRRLMSGHQCGGFPWSWREA